MSFSEILKNLLIDEGITQYQLAKSIGYTQRAVSKWVNNQSEPTETAIRKCAEFFNVSIDYLLGKSEFYTAMIADNRGNHIQLKYGEALKHQREINGYTQSPFEKATGIQQQMTIWWETNKGLQNIDFCVQLANFCGITLEELLGLEDEIPPEPKTSAVAPIHSADIDYTDEERALIEEYRKLPADSKKLILRMIGVTSDTQTTKKKA